MEGVILIVYILFWATVNACFAWFLDVCFDEGMIFEKWRPTLAKFLLGKKANKIGIQKGTPAYIDELKDMASEETFWYKPLGGCVVCFSVWLSVPVFFACLHLFKIDFSLLSLLIMWLFYAVISNSIVRLLIKD